MKNCSLVALILSLALPLSLSACADSMSSPDEDRVQSLESLSVPASCASRTGGALVTVEVGHENPEQFTAWITNPDFIAEANRLLADGERGTPNFKFVDGTDCDSQWAFHVDAADAEFPWGTIEVCDAMPSYVNQNRSYWIEKNLRWCPWGSRVVSVEQK